MRRLAWAGGLVLGVGLMLVGQPARAVITALFPLRGVLKTEQHIFVAKVAALDPAKPTMILQVDEDLKGKAPFRRMPVSLKGDAEAEKEKQRPELLKRLAPDLALIVFTSKRGPRYTGFAYSNGTWFQMIGHEDEKDPTVVRWMFSHCEPYLRRTFKGTTADLRQVILDGLSGKKDPPEPDPKEPPGLGPEVKPKPDAAPKGGTGLRTAGGPLFAVIPTFVLVGPVALLAALFPAVFGGLAGLLRRWAAFITIASLNSTLAMAHVWCRNWIKDYWWGTPLALWVALSVLTLAGALWSGWRHRTGAQADQANDGVPPRGEQVVLWILSVGCFGLALYCLLWGGGSEALLASPWRELLIVSAGVWVATLYAVYLRLIVRRGAPSVAALSIEAVMLWTMVFASSTLLAASWQGHRTAGGLGGVELGDSSAQAVDRTRTITRTAIPWVFQAPDLGRIVSTPLVSGDRIYVTAAHQAGFEAFGAVYCLDRATGTKVVWKFDNGGDLKQVFSSPCLADGRLYFGEGFHTDKDCRFFCLDAATGAKLWDVPTSSHTESSPAVADGKVFFGAGDDGLYCLDAKTKKELWHFTGLHIDTPPVVVGKRLYAGSGYGLYRAFCLDAETGKPIWEVELNLPSFGAPRVAGEHVYYGTGNGDFLKSEDHPAGALLCLEAATGRLVWRYDVPDAIHGQPAVDDRHVYFGARDRSFYCLGRKDGRLSWKRPLGSAIVASPELVRCACCGGSTSLYAVTSAGLVCCLDPDNGQDYWQLDVSTQSRSTPLLVSSPKLVAGPNGAPRRWLYFGAGLGNQDTWRAAVYCIEDELKPR
jgi:outer membrane protein assembly factor BamB